MRTSSFAATLAIAAAVAAPGEARADEEYVYGAPSPPATGTDTLAAGIVLSSIGALSFATAPLCTTDIVIATEQGSCVSTSFLVGAPFLALGVSFTAIGLWQRGRYRAWKKTHPFLGELSVAPGPRGGTLSFHF